MRTVTFQTDGKCVVSISNAESEDFGFVALRIKDDTEGCDGNCIAWMDKETAMLLSVALKLAAKSLGAK